MIKAMSLGRAKFTARPLFHIILMAGLFIFSFHLTKLFYVEYFGGPDYFAGRHYDFLAFYTASHHTLNDMITRIYDAESMRSFERTIVPYPVSGLGYMPFLNPPFVAVLLSPLALMSVNTSRAVWIIINLSLMVLIAVRLLKGIKPVWFQVPLLVLLVCSYPVYQNLIQGQFSIFILAGCLLALHYIERGRLVLGGAFLAVLAAKPQLAIFLGIGLLLYKQWNIIKGMVLATLVLVLVTLPVTGVDLYKTYAQFSSAVTSGHFNGAGAVGPTAWQGSLTFAFGLNGLFTSMFGQSRVGMVNGFTLGSIVVLLALFAVVARRQKPNLNSSPGRLVLAAGLTIIMLMNPHAYAHDLILAFGILAIILPIKHQATKILVFLSAISFSSYDDKHGTHIITYALLAFIAHACIYALAVSHGKRIDASKITKKQKPA